MTVMAQPTTLTRDEAKAVIVSWTELGLPDARIQFHPTEEGKVFLQVPDLNCVAIWAAVLGVDINLDCFAADYSRYTHWIGPDALPGWRLSVYCDYPVIPDSLRIPCGGVSR